MSKIQEALNKIQPNSTSKSRSASLSKSAGKNESGKKLLDSPELRQAIPEFSGPRINVDIARLRAAGLLPPEKQERILARQYREIKRPLIANAFGKRVVRVEDGRLIAITSSVPGEGKTFTSLNLAFSIAQEQDYSVLLVDADVAKPHISDVFGIGKESGLLDLLENRALDPESVISPSDIPGFSVLPAGVPRDHATELLSSQRMEQIVRYLAESDERRIILFDTPPLLRTSEAKVLAGVVGQVVLVVKSETTPQGIVVDAVKALDSAQVVNLLLNQSMSGAASYNYGYNYHYDANLQSGQSSESGANGSKMEEKKRGLWE